MQLVADAVAGSNRGGIYGSGSATETLPWATQGYRTGRGGRCLLGVRQAMPKGAVLIKTGERPQWARWLQHAGCLWNRFIKSE